LKEIPGSDSIKIQMTHKFDSEFIEISIPILKKISGKLQFDIFIKRATNTYTKLFQKGDVIETDRMEHYWVNKNLDKLSVNKNDYRQYLFYVEQLANRYHDNKKVFEPEEIVQITREMIDLTMLEMFVDYNINQESLTHASQAVQGCVDVLANDPKSLSIIFQHITSHPYLMKHSVATSIYSLMLARIEKCQSDRTFSRLGIGALVHDVGMSRVSFDPESKSELSSEEWKEIKEHPQIGKRIMDGVKGIPSEVREIVLQHHEQPNGMGYPNGLFDKNIYYLAKIVAVADSFSALTSKRPYQGSFPPLKALEIMHIDQGKFDRKLLKSFSTLFIHLKEDK